jgi:hypothetical protein
MKIFLICPVRNVTTEQKQNIEAYVSSLETQGHVVHWPQRDTQQDDPIGTRICADNRQAIINADEIHAWWSSNSTGSLFDLGMAWMLRKSLVIANPSDVQLTESKSFDNVLLHWSDTL